MKSFPKKFLLLLLSSTLSCYAFLGVGIHTLLPTPTLQNFTSTTNLFTISRETTKLTTIGLKIWLDFFSSIELEATSNLYYSRYQLSVIIDTSQVGTIDSSTIATSNNYYQNIDVDLTLLYPFLKFPTSANILKFYIGFGITTSSSTILSNSASIEDVAKSNKLSTKKEITDALADGSTSLIKITESISTNENTNNTITHLTIGAHVLIGAKVKIPKTEINIYANSKIYAISQKTDGIEYSLYLFELGIALSL